MRRLSRWASAPRAAFRPSSHAADDAASSTTRVYLSNLPFDGLRHAALRACLERAGTVAQLVVPKTPEGRSRGYGFAEYASAAGARRARASLDGVEFGGRAMHVRPYRGRSGAERAVARADAFEDPAAADDEPPPPAVAHGEAARVFVGNLPYAAGWREARRPRGRPRDFVSNADPARSPLRARNPGARVLRCRGPSTSPRRNAPRGSADVDRVCDAALRDELARCRRGRRAQRRPPQRPAFDRGPAGARAGRAGLRRRRRSCLPRSLTAPYLD